MLESFIRFGAQRYPARATALVLLNHGSGLYVPPEMLSRDGKAPGHAGASPAAVRRRRRPVFHTTRERLGEATPPGRGIAHDDGAADCLDNQELTRVLASAHHILGRKVDVVGMDVCLMTMIEVAYQLRDHAHVLVGGRARTRLAAQAILGDLAKKPTITPAELGATVVHRYIESYRHGGATATQSAIDLGQLNDLVEAMDVLARRLLASIKGAGRAAAVLRARRRTLQFFEGLYVDLHHLAGCLVMATGKGRIADACRDVQRVVEGEGARSPTPVGEICRKLGVSEQSFYRWKKRFGALGVSELRELRQLREENRKVKGLVADLGLDKTILHEALKKNGKARRPARTGAVGAGSIPAIRTSGLPRGARRTVQDPLPEPPAVAAAAPGTAAGTRQCAAAGWLPATACVSPAGGLAGEPQAGLSAVHRGRVGAPTAPAAAASQVVHKHHPGGRAS